MPYLHLQECIALALCDTLAGKFLQDAPTRELHRSLLRGLGRGLGERLADETRTAQQMDYLRLSLRMEIRKQVCYGCASCEPDCEYWSGTLASIKEPRGYSRPLRCLVRAIGGRTGSKFSSAMWSFGRCLCRDETNRWRVRGNGRGAKGDARVAAVKPLPTQRQARGSTLDASECRMMTYKD